MIIDNNKYPLPIKIGFKIDPSLESHKIWKQYKFNDTYALDFLVPEKTSVYSICSGTIIRMNYLSNIGGDNFQYAGRDNKIYIKDENSDLIFAYRHLAYKTPDEISIFVQEKRGRVKKGDKLGEVSMTGWTSESHLHFVAYKLMAPDFLSSQEILLP